MPGALALALALGVQADSVPSEESFLQAWEAHQKRDPKSVAFEKLGARRYRSRRRGFPSTASSG